MKITLNRNKLLVFGLPILAVVVLGTAVYAQTTSVANVKSEPVAEVKRNSSEPTKPEIAKPEKAAETQSATATTEETPVPSPEPTPVQQAEEKNPFDPGWAAWYAFERRQELGLSWPDGGSDHQRYCDVVNQSLFVSSPSIHAIGCQKSTSADGRGSHVVVVEKINEAGSIQVSEMNGADGFYKKSFRTLSEDEVASWKFLK